MIKKIYEFIKNTIKVITEYVKDIISNAPACTLLVTSTIGISSLLQTLPIEVYCVSIPFINELVVCSIMAVGITYTLILLTQVWSLELCHN